MSTLTSTALQEFQDAAAYGQPGSPGMEKPGGKVIGCIYHFISEELITAAGLLPYRMRATGSTGTELSEGRFTQVNCSLVRHFYDSGMRGDQNFLDGVVTVNNCDHIRRLFDNWKSKIKTPTCTFQFSQKER